MLRRSAVCCWFVLFSALFPFVALGPACRWIFQGNGRLVIVDREGRVDWEMKWGGIHDIHVLANGNVMVQQGGAKVVEIDRQDQSGLGIRFHSSKRQHRRKCIPSSRWPTAA